MLKSKGPENSSRGKTEGDVNRRLRDRDELQKDFSKKRELNGEIADCTDDHAGKRTDVEKREEERGDSEGMNAEKTPLDSTSKTSEVQTEVRVV